MGAGEGRTRRGRGVDVGSTRVVRLPGARVPGGRGGGMRVTGAAGEACGKIGWLV